MEWTLLRCYLFNTSNVYRLFIGSRLQRNGPRLLQYITMKRYLCLCMSQNSQSFLRDVPNLSTPCSFPFPNLAKLNRILFSAAKYWIDHFTVVCSVTWPLSGSEAGDGPFWYRSHCFCYVNKFCWIIDIERSREVCIKSRSPPVSLPFIGQVTKHTTVKWPILIVTLTISHRMSTDISLV